MRMSLPHEGPEFTPPPQRGTGRALLLALIAHALLIAALTWGVRWKRDGDDDAIEAEIWSSTTQQAAQRTAVAPSPPPAPAPRPAPPPPPPPPPPPEAVKPPPAPPPPKEPDIALERERKLREEQAQRERERQQQQEKRRQEAERKAAQEKKEAEERRREEEAERQKEKEQQRLAEQKKREQAEKAAAAKAAAEKKAAAERAAAAEKARQDNIRRMLGQANGAASGQAEANSGPRSGQGAGSGGVSAGYLGRVAALIKRNTVFDPNSISGNPEALIEIQTAPDGTIVGTPRLVKSSGNKAWDEAALRAVQRTEVMPRDTDGRVPSPFPQIVMRPKN